MAMRLEKLLGTSAEKLAADAAGGGTVGSAPAARAFRHDQEVAGSGSDVSSSNKTSMPEAV